MMKASKTYIKNSERFQICHLCTVIFEIYLFLFFVSTQHMAVDCCNHCVNAQDMSAREFSHNDWVRTNKFIKTKEFSKVSFLFVGAKFTLKEKWAIRRASLFKSPQGSWVYEYISWKQDKGASVTAALLTLDEFFAFRIVMLLELFYYRFTSVHKLQLKSSI